MPLHPHSQCEVKKKHQVHPKVRPSRLSTHSAKVLQKEGFSSLRCSEEGEGVSQASRPRTQLQRKHPPADDPLRCGASGKPGLRIYKNTRQLPKVLGGLGVAIISTSRGVMSDRDAVKQGVGGEVLPLLHLLIRKVIHVTHRVKRGRSPSPTSRTVNLEGGLAVSVKVPQGELTRPPDGVVVQPGTMALSAFEARQRQGRRSLRNAWALRTLVANMVKGRARFFPASFEIHRRRYRAAVQGEADRSRRLQPPA